MDINKFLQSKTIKITLISIVVVIILLLTFGVGEFVGYRKARFSYRWADNYHRNFGGPRGGIFRDSLRDFDGRDYMNAHGVSGLIIKIDGDILVIKSEDNTEKIAVILDKTVIRRGLEIMKSPDFKINDRVSIIGSPNDSGQVEAQFIRVFP